MVNIKELIESCKYGNIESKYQLGKEFEFRKNYLESANFYEEAAKKGHTDASFRLRFNNKVE